MYNYLFEVNKQNAYTLAEKHNLSDYDRDYIHRCFWPIIKVNNYDLESIKEKLNDLKKEFIKENTIFDIEIFNRESIDYLTYSLKQFIDVLERGKAEMFDKYGNENFYIFKMKNDTERDTTLIISEKTVTQLEIYFKSVLNIIQADITELPTKNANKELPKLENVFFVHYQCEDFEKGTQIHNLSIYTDNKTIEYYKNTESENIEHYCNKVTELCNKGLIPIHWGQNKTYYGSEHITDRYKELTGKTIVLEYTNSINLSEWLINTYGERYIAHPRLDNLAKLNEFNGITDKVSRIFHTNRLFLLTKIYFNALNGTLKTQSENLDLSDTSVVEKPSFTNEFDSVPESKVIEYFTKNLVENKHLTKETLTAYLKQAFELKTPPKQKYSFENIKTKEKIVSIFYKYYKETADKPHGKQQMYLDLLKIYFSGFEKINIRNFSK